MAVAAPASSSPGQQAFPVPAGTLSSPAALRDIFLKRSVRRNQPMDSLTTSNTLIAGVPATSYSPPTGLARFVRLSCQATVTVTIGTGTVALSPRAPYNIFQNIEFRDPASNLRISASGFELYLLKIVKDIAGADPQFTPITYPYSGILNATFPIVNGANAWDFFIDVPFEYSAIDPRGVMNLESPQARAYINMTVNSAFAGATNDSVIVTTGNATATLTMTCTPQYYFYSPVLVEDNQGVPHTILPYEDMSVVHEYVSGRQGALTTNSDNHFTLPNGRSYYRIFCQQFLGGGPGAGTVPVTGQVNTLGDAPGATNVKLMLSTTNVIQNEPLLAYLQRVRDDYNRDFPAGVFFWDMTNHPWDSNRWGAIDVAVTAAAAANVTNAYLQVARESLFRAPVAA
jgi:hypothetical protein